MVTRVTTYFTSTHSTGGSKDLLRCLKLPTAIHCCTVSLNTNKEDNRLVGDGSGRMTPAGLADLTWCIQALLNGVIVCVWHSALQLLLPEHVCYGCSSCGDKSFTHLCRLLWWYCTLQLKWQLFYSCRICSALHPLCYGCLYLSLVTWRLHNSGLTECLSYSGRAWLRLSDTGNVYGWQTSLGGKSKQLNHSKDWTKY